MLMRCGCCGDAPERGRAASIMVGADLGLVHPVANEVAARPRGGDGRSSAIARAVDAEARLPRPRGRIELFTGRHHGRSRARRGRGRRRRS